MMPLMTETPSAILLGDGPDPLDVLAQWPEGKPLAALVTARGGSPLARWSILSTPRGFEHPEITSENVGFPSRRFDCTTELKPDPNPDAPPFRGGRLLALTYELGRRIEPRAGLGPMPAPDGDFPGGGIVFDCPSALVHDRMLDRWWFVGDPNDRTDLTGCLDTRPVQSRGRPCVSPLTPETGDEEFAERVSRTIEYIHAGDLFQANITRRYSSKARLPTRADRRAFSASLILESQAWFGAHMEIPDEGGSDRTLISLSPELFLHFDPNDRILRTRPIKGTLPAGEDPAKLLASEKDAAELAMIVDLMRNDLGRISEPGSVVVEEGRVIETHPGVIHGVAEVAGRLRDGLDLDDVLRATFPPGSITGAPKIRAMQVIDEFESVPRGPYCGALGFQSVCGHMALDVSIRTLDLVPTMGDDWSTHQLRYGAGCGIVAESDPVSETVECDTKARLLSDHIRTHCEPPGSLSSR